MLADLAGLSRFVRAVYTTMTRLATEVALASELTLDARVLAFCLVVAHFAAIVTFAGVLLVRAVTSKVAILVAAGDVSAETKRLWRRLLTCWCQWGHLGERFRNRFGCEFTLIRYISCCDKPVF